MSLCAFTTKEGPYGTIQIQNGVVNGGGVFGTPTTQVERIQRSIDEHVTDGWELFVYHPVQTALVWKWNILIFRKPSDGTP